LNPNTIEETISSFTDVQLLQTIGDKLNHPIKAHEAFVEFVKRYQKDLYRQCKIVCQKQRYDQHVARDIAHNVFYKVEKYANSFNCDKGTGQSPRDKIILWLIKIAKNELFNYYQEIKDKKELFLNDVLENNPLPASLIQIDNGDQEEENEAKLESREQAVEMILSVLTDKERAVYLAYKQYETDGKYLPREIIKGLTIRLNLKPASLRKYKQRAEEKIIEAIKQLNQNNNG
jgi:DNA-directed RNA polymerase specialized sigma24 family protein